MEPKRRTYDPAFKQMAVELCKSGKKPSEVAADLGITASILNRWQREYAAKGQGRFPGKGKPTLSSEEAEISPGNKNSNQ